MTDEVTRMLDKSATYLDYSARYSKASAFAMAGVPIALIGGQVGKHLSMPAGVAMLTVAVAMLIVTIVCGIRIRREEKAWERAQ